MDTIAINKQALPYTCSMLLGGEWFELQFNYNATADLFTVRLSKAGELICAGEPVVYGQRLFAQVYEAGRFPACDIVPLDPSGESNAVTYDNFGDTVLLVVDDAQGALT